MQNRVATALSSLPQAVQAQGVTVQKRSTAILLFVTLTSPDGSYDSLYLANYATISLRDELSRLPGVGNVNVFGAGQYSMRIWLDPEKLKARSLNAQDVVLALQQQSQEVTAGQVGMPPTPPGVDFQYTIEIAGPARPMSTQFENVIVKTGNNGEVTRVRDVGRVELGAQTYSQAFTLDGKPAAGIGIYQSPGANALEVEHVVKAKMEELARQFPQGLVYSTPFDTTVFVNASIHEVYKTLIEAAVLVLIVILVFLQDWRAMLVPATTVPVTIVGAFAAMWALGFTVNFSTLFAIVLSIGIVVDDAIVVVEGAAHNIEKGMSGHDAAIRAMTELLGPIIGITLVLMSVFLPAAFLPGLTGRMYAQFALVIAATALLSRHQCADAQTDPGGDVAAGAGAAGTAQCVLSRLQRGLRPHRAQLCRPDRPHGGACRPDDADRLCHHGRGFLRTVAGADRIFADRRPGLSAGRGSIAGRRLAGPYASGDATGFRDRAERRQRRPRHQHFGGLGARQQRHARQCRRRLCGAQGLERSRRFAHAVFPGCRKRSAPSTPRVIVLPPPPIQGIGNAGGFTMQVELRDGSTDLAKLQSITDTIVGNAQSQSALQRVSTSFRAAAPQIRVDVDRVKAQTLHVPVDQVFADARDLFRLELSSPSSTNSAGCSRSMRRPTPSSGCGRATSNNSRCAIKPAT